MEMEIIDEIWKLKEEERKRKKKRKSNVGSVLGKKIGSIGEGDEENGGGR